MTALTDKDRENCQKATFNVADYLKFACNPTQTTNTYLKYDTCQTKNKVYTEVSDSCDGDSGTSPFSRYSWQYDGFFSAFVLLVCAIIVFIILLVVIW